MRIIYINGIAKELDTDIVRQQVDKMIPRHWKDEGIEDIVDEICFRISSLEFDNPDFIPEEKYAIACIDYMLKEGDGDPIGIDLLINEIDDCRIWDYLQ